MSKSCLRHKDVPGSASQSPKKTFEAGLVSLALFTALEKSRMKSLQSNVDKLDGATWHLEKQKTRNKKQLKIETQSQQRWVLEVAWLKEDNKTT